MRPDRHRPDLYDETNPYTHILDALRYWAVNRSSGTPWMPPESDYGVLEPGFYRRIW